MKKDSIAICGTKTTTLPTPAMTPSAARSARFPSGRTALTAPCSHAVAVSMAPMNGSDHVNRASKTTAMTTAKTAMP